MFTFPLGRGKLSHVFPLPLSSPAALSRMSPGFPVGVAAESVRPTREVCFELAEHEGAGWSRLEKAYFPVSSFTATPRGFTQQIGDRSLRSALTSEESPRTTRCFAISETQGKQFHQKLRTFVVRSFCQHWPKSSLFEPHVIFAVNRGLRCRCSDLTGPRSFFWRPFRRIQQNRV